MGNAAIGAWVQITAWVRKVSRKKVEFVEKGKCGKSTDHKPNDDQDSENSNCVEMIVHFLANVQVLANLPARASVKTEVEVVVTENDRNRTAGRGCHGAACWASSVFRQQREKTAWEAIADTTDDGTANATIPIPRYIIIPNPAKTALMVEKPFG